MSGGSRGGGGGGGGGAYSIEQLESITLRRICSQHTVAQ